MSGCTFTISSLTVDAASLAAFPATGEVGKVYVALDTDLIYRWSGTAYINVARPLRLAVRDEGVSRTSAATSLNFTGGGATATSVGGVVTVNVPSSTLSLSDDGAPLGAFGVLNVVGSGLTVSVAGNTATLAAAPTPATINSLTSAGNTLTSVIDGVAATAPAVNSNVLAFTAGAITSTVNGVVSGAVTLPVVAVLDEVSNLTSAVASLTFTGAGVTATAAGSAVTVDIPQSFLPIAEEGIVVQAAPTTLNFVGGGITATTVRTVATVTVPSVGIQDDGVGVQATPSAINFVGAGVAVTDVAGVATITIPALPFQDAGVEVVAAPTAVNFVGSNATVTNVAGVATVTIASVDMQGEGVSVQAAPTAVNFVGAGVTASTVGTVATVTIPSTAVQEEGAVITAVPSAINFVGAGVTVTDAAGVATVTITSAALPVQDEGVLVQAAPTALNFVGAGVTATTVGSVATITIPTDALKQDLAGKDASNGYAGLTLFKLNLRNAANTVTNFFTTASTAARTWTLQDRSGVLADDTDLAGKAPLDSPVFTTQTTTPRVITATGVSTVGTAVPGTIFTAPAGTNAIYTVAANIGITNDPTNYAAFATIMADGNQLRRMAGADGLLLAITVSGLNVLATQTTGVSQTINATITRTG